MRSSSSNTPAIDLAILTRDGAPVALSVADGVRRLRGVDLRVHRIIGAPRDGDANRVATIVRARNEAVRIASSPWLMFLDDDVQLEPDSVARLHHALASRPDFAALGADYLGEANRRGSSPHVSMGATLFRRSMLERTPFRWEPKKCECLCCCEDLRSQGARVEYLPGVRARHLPRTLVESDQRLQQSACLKCDADPELARRAKILVAFNRRDVHRFRDAFLKTLRASGNVQEVIVVGYGLYPSETRLLSSSPGVRVVSKAVNGQMPPVRRLRDFSEICGSLPSDTPVAYWDAGDVIFQGSLAPLWAMTEEFPDKILAVREPKGYPDNQAIFGWTQSIDHPQMRRRALELFATHPFLNSGFAAGSAATMMNYFAEATRLRSSSELRGTTDWGDQSAMNLYCHSNSSRWQEIPQRWNFCVHDRPAGSVHVSPEGQVMYRDRAPVVVHGNARSLVKMALLR